MPQIVLTAAEVRKYQRPVRGHGGFQSLLRRLQKQIVDNVLTLSDDDLRKLWRNSWKYGEGGFQERTRPTARRTGPGTATKRVAKKR